MLLFVKSFNNLSLTTGFLKFDFFVELREGANEKLYYFKIDTNWVW